MELPARRIESEHHLDAVFASNKFQLDASGLRPYLITQGRWYIKVQYFASTAPLEGRGIFQTGLRLISLNVTSANERPLVLAAFSAHDFVDRRCCATFEHTRPFLITHPSDRLLFEVQTLEGGPVALPKNSFLLFGVALIQEK